MILAEAKGSVAERLTSESPKIGEIETKQEQ